MEQLRPRAGRRLPAMVLLLALAGIVWLVGAPHGARAAQSWDGPALKQVGGAPSILAESDLTSVSTGRGPLTAPSTSTRSVTTGSAANGAPYIAGRGSAAAGAVSTARIATPGNQGGSLPRMVGGGQNTTRKATTAGASAATTTAGSGMTAKQGPKSAAPASPALNLPTYAPVGVSGGQSLDGPTIVGLVFKFLVVLALLFIVLRVLKAIMPGGHGKRAGRDRPLLLHSESIGDKQRILLLDLGGKLVAVGVAGATMTTLTTIEDADAVDTIRARYAPLAEAVPGYQESKAPTPLSQSFMETLKRAGIVGQRQAESASAGPAAPTMPRARREAPAAGAGNGRRVLRGGEASTHPDERPPVEPILHEALEAMRAVRRRVEGA
jgi:flagellar biogenesis protein FliO